MNESIVVTFRKRDTNRAKTLRNQATPAERELWKYLNNRRVAGYKFSRQMPVGPYFADFLCRELKLIIEIDGYSHDTRQGYDLARTKDLENHGYRVARFSNRDVMTNVEGVVREIELIVSGMPSPDPSRRREGNL
ncbi:endonuclease domain-containing protein [Parasphingorhabdus marina]|uniref:endonuclease domain-containing protein n=1 Tax=Parasphingorhabdus marina TaxID=394732 RepID=UPI001EF5FDEA|nr:DUF559 domain-containing protein [Parasphingorhabdus marina]